MGNLEIKLKKRSHMKSAIVIDDDEDIVRVFSYLLEKKQVKVIGKGYSGKDAIELYETKNPDIVFLDVMMPDGNGIYAIKKIKEINPNAKIVAVTADDRSVTQEKLEGLDIFAIVHKPFEIKKIMQIIEN